MIQEQFTMLTPTGPLQHSEFVVPVPQDVTITGGRIEWDHHLMVLIPEPSAERAWFSTRATRFQDGKFIYPPIAGIRISGPAMWHDFSGKSYVIGGNHKRTGDPITEINADVGSGASNISARWWEDETVTIEVDANVLEGGADLDFDWHMILTTGVITFETE